MHSRHSCCWNNAGNSGADFWPTGCNCIRASEEIETMAKTKAKLSLKKETLRMLNGAELHAVAGGTKLPGPSTLCISLQCISAQCLSGDCQSGLTGGGGGTISCVRVATRCYDP